MAIFKKILIPFDGSLLSKRAAEKGLAIAIDQEAEVVGLNIITFEGVISPSDQLWAVIVDGLREKAGEILGELESMAKEKGLTIKLEIRDGGAEEEMVFVANEIGADIIVMGMGGTSGMGKHLGKSLARVLQEAPCPVMVVN